MRTNADGDLDALFFFRQPHLSNIEVPRMLRAIFHVASEACIHVSAIFRSWTWVGRGGR